MRNILLISVFSFSLVSTQFGFGDAQQSTPTQSLIQKKATTPPSTQAEKKSITPPSSGLEKKATSPSLDVEKKTTTPSSTDLKKTPASSGLEKKAATDPTIKKETIPTPIEEDSAEKPPPSYENSFMKMILLFIGLIILIFLTIWFIKRFSRSRITQMNHLRNIKILERRPLSPKTMLYLVEVAGKQIVISESHLEIRNITDINLSK